MLVKLPRMGYNVLMSALRAFIISIIIALSIAFISVWGYQLGIATGRLETEIKLSVAMVLIEDNLVGWVYSKSEKISIDTAKLIVEEVLKTERPLLILAMISTESEFVPSATSHKDAIGLMQIIWRFHGKALVEAQLAKEKRDLYDISTSIQSGNFLMNGFLKQENGDLEKALHRYLGGKDGNYVRRILLNLGNLYLITGEIKGTGRNRKM
jgi:hypothetical protein